MSKNSGIATVKLDLKKKRGRPLNTISHGEMFRLILDAAIECFAAGGYVGTSNRDIAKRAGVTSGLLYHYFDSKAALFHEALKDVNSKLLEVFKEASTLNYDATVLEQLILGSKGALRLTKKNPSIVLFAGHADAEIQRHPELTLTKNIGQDEFKKFFSELLTLAKKRGELDKNIKVEAGVRVLAGFMTRLASIGSGGESGFKELSENLTVFESMLRGNFLR
ncbi:TetR/AcrR family transcriptional regulator [Polynucleobacter sp. 30F-ANTBAC]|uniref:TetR/AcrR family transcriptional regulator n=1 Tax=Polynucleobacter sp. 30F-ANTBAC TaxID=2689095 RepID=UPI001C0CCEC6|nr:TetR/AcrR family transcriptional regulator [Polynucleobacter sp. 30F-ANTBAC]